MDQTPTKDINHSAVFINLKERIDAVEKFNTYYSVSDLKKAAVCPFVYYLKTLGEVHQYSYISGNYTGLDDDINVIALDDTPIASGALVKNTGKSLWVRRKGSGFSRDLEEKLLGITSVNDYGAKGDGVTDDSDAINAAILDLFKNGGGELIFEDRDKSYFCAKPIYLTTDIAVNLNGQTIQGVPGQPLFKTGLVKNGVMVPLTSFDPFQVVRSGSVFGGKITQAGIAFDLQSWVQGCVVYDIAFEGCRQGFVLRDCFYSIWRNVHTSPPGTDFNYPFYHLAAANNAMLFDRVTCVVPNGWLIENGSSSLMWNCCTFEGGGIGFKFKGPGDAMGILFQGCYFESITGTLFDFSKAGACWVDFIANYINGVDVIFEDGGAATTATLFGRWSASNKIANINNTLGGTFVYRGQMRVSGSRNYIEYEREPVAEVNLNLHANWIVSNQTRFVGINYWNADGFVDIRAVAVHHAGITPRAYGGNVGTPFAGTIPFSTITLPAGASVSATVTTQIKLQNNASVVHFVISITDNAALKKVSGTIYGDFVDQRQGSGTNPVLLSQNSDGKIVLSIGGIVNSNGLSFLTGSVFQAT